MLYLFGLNCCIYDYFAENKAQPISGEHAHLVSAYEIIRSSFRFPRANASLTREQALLWVRDWEHVGNVSAVPEILNWVHACMVTIRVTMVALNH